MRVLGLRLPSGKRRFCDARCYNSTKRHCNCICGGLLHGKGEFHAKCNAFKVRSYIDRIRKTICPVWINPKLVPESRD